MPALPVSEGDDFYAPLSNGLERESNQTFRVPTQVRFSYFEGHQRMFGSKVREHFGHIAKV